MKYHHLPMIHKTLSLILIIHLGLNAQTQNTAHDWHAYGLASYNLFRGNMETAATLLEDIHKKNASPYALKAYAYYLVAKQDYAGLASLAPQLEKQFPQDLDLRIITAKSLDAVGQHDDALSRIIELNKAHPDNPELAMQAAQAYALRPDFEAAHTTLKTYLDNSTHKQHDFVFHFLEAQIYEKEGKRAQALASIKTSLELFPQFDKGWLFYAFLQDQAGQLEEAIKGYSSFLEITGTPNKEVESILLNLMLKQKLAARNTASAVVSQSCFETAVALFNEHKFQQALDQLDSCLNENTADKKEKLLKIQILNAMHKYDGVVKSIKPWLLADAHDPVWYQTLHMLCRTGFPCSKATKLLQDILRKEPENVTALLYAADLHTKAHNIPAAITAHKRALEHTTDTEMKAKILCHLALIYYEQHQEKELASAIEQAEQLHSSYAPLLNVMAYHYAVHSNCEKAQETLDQALAQQAHNPYFLDTQATIWIEQGNYDKALELLITLQKQLPHESTICFHVAHALHKKGQQHEALAAMHQAHALAHTAAEKSEYMSFIKHWSKTTL